MSIFSPKTIDMKRLQLLVLSAAVAAACTANAQSKLDMELGLLLGRQQAQARSASSRGEDISKASAYVSVLAQLEPGAELPATQLSEMGAKVNGHYGSIAALTVPISQLEELAQLPVFRAIELDRPLHPLCQKSREVQHVDEVHQPTSTDVLPHGYTGRGVLVGVVDEGIDYNHNNFRDPVTHQTRIVDAIVYRGLYAINDYIVIDEEFNLVDNISDYRYEYTDPAAIDTLTADCYTDCHGTHTAGIAAGSYSGDYLDAQGTVVARGQHGMAPEADLMLAGIGIEPYTPASILMDAVSTLASRAEERQQPLAINLSVGLVGGWQDGKELFCQFCDDLTQDGSRPGLIICIATGNEGSTYNTILTHLDESCNHEYRAFLDDVKLNQNGIFTKQICVFADDATPVEFSIEFWTFGETISRVDSLTLTSEQLIEAGLLTAGTYANHDGRYACKLEVLPEDGIRLPEGAYPVVVLKSQTDCSLRLSTFDYAGGTSFIPAPGYISMDGKEVIGTDRRSISDIACTNSVLSIGGWQASDRHSTYNGGTFVIPADYSNPDSYYFFTSFCDADDNGVQRPDVCAPAVEVLSSVNSYDCNIWNGSESLDEQVLMGRADQQYLEGHTSLLGSLSGTSMAAPNACGVMALWLQADPTLSVNDAREIIRATADQDEYTAADSDRFGAGKLNALTGLQWILNNRPTAIRDLQAAERLTDGLMPRKYLRQGQLIIEHNGSCYSAWGNRVR